MMNHSFTASCFAVGEFGNNGSGCDLVAKPGGEADTTTHHPQSLQTSPMRRNLAQDGTSQDQGCETVFGSRFAQGPRIVWCTSEQKRRTKTLWRVGEPGGGGPSDIKVLAAPQ